MTNKDKVIQIIKFIVFLVSLYLVFRFLLFPAITSTRFEQLTQSLGIFGYFIIISYVIISHVFAPVAGTPGFALGVAIYGINTGMWLLYFGSLISATINFAISKRFGRPWIIKLVGKQSMTKVDQFASVEGKHALIISRLFGFSLFDFISYAAGLTKMKYRDYITITAVFSLIPNLIIKYIFKDLDFQSETGILIWLVSIGLAGIAFGIVTNHYFKKHNKSNLQEKTENLHAE